MADSKPGDGKTSPFGNGSGGTSGGSMAGNDFTRNPQGSGPTGGPGVDFNTNPGGKGASAPKPRDFTQSMSEKQKTGEDPDLNPASEIRDKGGLVPLADVPANSPRKGLIGTTADPGQRKPFKLNGGS